jgi:hypothetical protein
MNTRVVATRNQVSSTLEGEAVILNLDDCVYYGLNETGLAVWELAQEPVFAWQIRDEIVRRFEVKSDSCESEILSLLEQLKNSSLLEVAPLD